MAKNKPQDYDIYVEEGQTAYGTKDNDIFHISATTKSATIVPLNQATDTLKFDVMCYSVKAYHTSGTKDLVITYEHGSDHDFHTITIKDYFSSTKATATKSSLKTLYFKDDASTVYEIPISTSLPIDRDLYEYYGKRNTINGTNFGDYIALNNGATEYTTIKSGNGDDYIIGSKEADTINGGNGNDYIVGYSGNDTITGGKGNNIYAYSAITDDPNGNDIINLTKGENATIYYGTDLNNPLYRLDGLGNATITFDTDKQYRGEVTLKGFAKKDVANEVGLQVMADAPIDLKTQLWKINAINDYKGGWLNEHIDATGIDEAKKNKNGKIIAYTFNGGKGDDLIEASDFTDKITGGVGANTYKYTTLDQLDGDKIYLTKGEKALIDVGDLTATGYEVVGKDLVVTVTDGVDEGTFTIVNFGTKDITNNKKKKVEDSSYVLLNDSTSDDEGSIDLRYEIQVKSDKGTFHNDYINRSASGKGLSINGGAGNDTIIGTDKKDTIKAGTGDFESITGGKGNDNLYASTTEHSVTKFFFKKGDGNDTVYSGKGFVEDGDSGDTLVLDGVSVGDLAFERKGKNLKITYADSDSITVKDYFKTNRKGELTTSIRNIDLLEGGFTIEELLNADNRITGESPINADRNNCLIIGNETDDTINANGNGNIIVAKGGADTINITGSAIVNAGGGENTINFASNTSGWVIDGGGTDTLGFAKSEQLTGMDDLNIDIAPNEEDLIIYLPTDDTVTIEDYMTNQDHSAKLIKVGDDTVAIDNFVNQYDADFAAQQTITATNWHDNIYTTYEHKGSEYAEIYAGDGNDIIHITEDSDSPDVYVGEGNDTVSLESAKPNVDIYFNAGDGNNILSGLNDSINTDTKINLHSNSLVHSIYLGGEMGENGFYSYVQGYYDGGSNDLTIKLTGGETFTIKNYKYVEDDIKDTINVYPNSTMYNKKLSEYRQIKDVITLPNGESSHEGIYDRLYVADSNSVSDAPRTVTFNGGSEYDVVIVGENNQTVNLNNVDEAKVYLYNTGDSTGTTNQSNVTVSGGEANNVYIDGKVDANVTVSGVDTGVYIYDCRKCNVTTGEGSSSSVYIKTSNDFYTNTVTSNGSDDIEIESGKSNIKLNGEDGKRVTLNENANVARISGIVDSYSVNITRTLSDDTNFADVMFEHYSDGSGSTENDLYIKYVDEDVKVLNSNNTVTLVGKGATHGEYNLDTDDVAQNVKIKVTNVSGTKTVSKKLGEMTQYVNINHGRYNNLVDFTDSDQSYLFAHRAGAYIRGTSDDDTYHGYTFLDGKVAISDEGGNNDKLELSENKSSCNFFIDFYAGGDVEAHSNLIIFNDTDKSAADGLYNYLGYGGHAGELDYVSEYVQIKNGFSGNSYSGVGAIETISAYDNGDNWYQFNVNSYVNAIKSNIAGWLFDYNSAHVGLDCNTVSEAISNGLSAAERDSLYAIYNNGAANQWSQINA